MRKSGSFSTSKASLLFRRVSCTCESHVIVQRLCLFLKAEVCHCEWLTGEACLRGPTRVTGNAEAGGAYALQVPETQTAMYGKKKAVQQQCKCGRAQWLSELFFLGHDNG